MKTTRLPSPFALSLLALAPAGCGHRDTIVGKWQGTVTQPRGTMNSTFEFTQDGKETINTSVSAMGRMLPISISGTYTVDGANLTQTLTTMTVSGQSRPVPAYAVKPGAFTLDGDHLTLKDPSNKQSYTLTRVKE